jgi:hypothetical protein
MHVNRKLMLDGTSTSCGNKPSNIPRYIRAATVALQDAPSNVVFPQKAYRSADVLNRIVENIQQLPSMRH